MDRDGDKFTIINPPGRGRGAAARGGAASGE